MRLCSYCRAFTEGNDSSGSTSDPAGVEKATNDPTPTSTNVAPCCAVCLGLWDNCEQPNGLVGRLRDAISRALVPYGDPRDNRWSQSSNGGAPSISPPGDLVYRCLLATRKKDEASCLEKSSKFGQQAKERAKALLGEALSQIPTKSPDEKDHEASVVDREEQGYLGLHVQLVPSSATPRPADRFGSDSSRKRKRRGFPGQPQQQGGDPRANLERRLEAQGIVAWTINQAQIATKEMDRSSLARDGLLERPLPSGATALDIHVAIWRRPFYVRGEYTKSLRGVPQSPFFVVEGGETVRLGSTSVEEQIVPVVARHCGGMSTLNNSSSSSNGGASCRRDVVYGATKFHASGREDMDVRMLIRPKAPPPTTTTSSGARSSTAVVTGRPFVCEVIDALRMPTSVDLEAMANEINHVTPGSASTGVEDPIEEQYKAAAGTNGAYYYGCNPSGVGVSRLSLVPSAAFRSLQAETEHKVKHYGCLCWSEAALPPTAESIERELGWSFPVELAQRTPLRVLHRRAPAVRTRHVLTGSVAERVDGHHFRLRLSTGAGTYVKEFVHGDLGRTVPSVSSMLGCRTDILELDCEGVET